MVSVASLYHRTERPDLIVADGFRDGHWEELGGDGVCFGATVGATLSGHGDWVIEIRVPDDILHQYRMTDATGSYEDMFFLPADVANRFARERIYSPRRSDKRTEQI